MEILQRKYVRLITDSLSERLGVIGLGVVNVFCGHEGGLGDNVKAQAAL